MFDPKGILETLGNHDVRYIVIGGFAVSAHGYQRATKDLDIVPDPDLENLERLAAALAQLHAQIEGVDAKQLGIKLDAEGLSLGGNFVTITDKGRLDLFQFQNDEELHQKLVKNAIELQIGDIVFQVCSREDLLDLKRKAGRPQDLVDIDRLLDQ